MVADDSTDADAPAHRIKVAGRADLIVTDACWHVGDCDSKQRDDLIFNTLSKRSHTNQHAARPGSLDGHFDLVVTFRLKRGVGHMRERPLRRKPRANRWRQELLRARRDLAMRGRRAECQAVALRWLDGEAGAPSP